MKRLLLLSLSMLVVLPAFAVEPSTPGSSAQPELAKMISLDFQDASLSTVLSVLSFKTGQKFITDSELARKKIVLNLKDVSAEDALNALLDTYDLYYVRQPNTNIYVMKSKNEGNVTTVSKVFFLNYAFAKDLVETLKPKLTRGGTLNADERTNSLIVTDMSDNIDKIETLLSILDVPAQQVLLEAKIIDVQIGDGVKYGVNITNLYRADQFWTSPLELERDRVFEDYEAPTTSVMPKSWYQQGFAPGLAGSGKIGVSIIQDGYNVEGLIEALKTDNNAKLLTNPKLLVINNQEATIDIVEQIPYEQKTVDANGTALVSTEFKDVGIKLKVKPQINGDGSIILEVAPEQSFRTGESINNVPVIYTSKTNTTFMLVSGETAVIGGLIRETDSESEYKVPLLGDIPIIGYLFKKYSKDKTRNELTIFITAKIVK